MAMFGIDGKFFGGGKSPHLPPSIISCRCRSSRGPSRTARHTLGFRFDRRWIGDQHFLKRGFPPEKVNICPENYICSHINWICCQSIWLGNFKETQPHWTFQNAHCWKWFHLYLFIKLTSLSPGWTNPSDKHNRVFFQNKKWVQTAERELSGYLLTIHPPHQSESRQVSAADSRLLWPRGLPVGCEVVEWNTIPNL